MKLFNASFQLTILRYYLMMTVVIGTFILGVPTFAILALPIFLFTILGVSVEKPISIKETNKKAVMEFNTNEPIKAGENLAY